MYEAVHVPKIQGRGRLEVGSGCLSVPGVFFLHEGHLGEMWGSTWLWDKCSPGSLCARDKAAGDVAAGIENRILENALRGRIFPNVTWAPASILGTGLPSTSPMDSRGRVTERVAAASSSPTRAKWPSEQHGAPRSAAGAVMSPGSSWEDTLSPALPGLPLFTAGRAPRPAWGLLSSPTEPSDVNPTLSTSGWALRCNTCTVTVNTDANTQQTLNTVCEQLLLLV